MQGVEGLTAKAAEAIAQRDAVQANLLELDGSFGKRMLDGAALTGEIRRRWEAGTRIADPPLDALTALAAARTQTLHTERIVASPFAQRDELRGLLAAVTGYQQAILAREGQRR